MQPSKSAFHFVGTFFALFLCGTATAAQPLEPWDPAVFERVGELYGTAAAERLRSVHDLVLKYRDAPVETKLEVTNQQLNELPWLTDKEKWNKDDYWATPFETLTTFGGDCEDMAIGKFVVLRAMGIPKSKLNLAYVKLKQTGESHMVLLYGTPGKEPLLVLDNMREEIVPAPERKDLIGLMVFDADGSFRLIKDDGTNRSAGELVTGREMSKLETVKARIKETRETYRKYNKGRPLMPDD